VELVWATVTFNHLKVWYTFCVVTWSRIDLLWRKIECLRINNLVTEGLVGGLGLFWMRCIFLLSDVTTGTSDFNFLVLAICGCYIVIEDNHQILSGLR
jgi:hypothetical protein